MLCCRRPLRRRREDTGEFHLGLCDNTTHGTYRNGLRRQNYEVTALEEETCGDQPNMTFQLAVSCFNFTRLELAAHGNRRHASDDWLVDCFFVILDGGA